MASLFDKAAAFARSPKAQQMAQQAVAKGKEFAAKPENKQKIDNAVAKGKQFAAKPENRQRIEQIRNKLNGKDGRGGPGTTPGTR
jgi:FKBP-type peptidyl-prolyl cis-trans isomerase